MNIRTVMGVCLSLLVCAHCANESGSNAGGRNADGLTTGAAEQSVLRLLEERNIDISALADGEMYAVGSFAVDTGGDMFIYERKIKQIFKCSPTGALLAKIGQRGRGPGEYESVSSITLRENGEIGVCDPLNRKFVFYGSDGEMRGEKKFTFTAADGVPLKTGGYLFQKLDLPDSSRFNNVVFLTDGDFNTVKELHRQPTFNPQAAKINGVFYNFRCPVRGERIYIADQTKGYEIDVFDLSGNHLRTISRSFTPVAPTEAYKEFFISRIPPKVKEFVKAKLVFPEALPPFHDIVTMDNGGLLVITYEQAEQKNHFFVDIFDGQGKYMGRQAMFMPIFSAEFRILCRNHRLYMVSPGAHDSPRLIIYKIL